MHLAQVDSKQVAELERQWIDQLSDLEDVNPTRCLGAIARAKPIASGEHHDLYTYALVDSENVYHGIVFLSHACARSAKPWLKMLELTLAPRYADDNNPPKVKALCDIAGIVLTEVFDLISDIHRSDSVKIYGDSIMEARFWREFATPDNIPEDVELPFEISHHRSWLVLKKK